MEMCQEELLYPAMEEFFMNTSRSLAISQSNGWLSEYWPSARALAIYQCIGHVPVHWQSTRAMAIKTLAIYQSIGHQSISHLPERWPSKYRPSEYWPSEYWPSEYWPSEYWPSKYTIIIIKKGRQRKAKREWCTPYQSEDPSPTISTYRQKEEKGNKSRRLE